MLAGRVKAMGGERPGRTWGGGVRGKGGGGEGDKRGGGGGAGQMRVATRRTPVRSSRFLPKKRRRYSGGRIQAYKERWVKLEVSAGGQGV